MRQVLKLPKRSGQSAELEYSSCLREGVDLLYYNGRFTQNEYSIYLGEAVDFSKCSGEASHPLHLIQKNDKGSLVLDQNKTPFIFIYELEIRLEPYDELIC